MKFNNFALICSDGTVAISSREDLVSKTNSLMELLESDVTLKVYGLSPPVASIEVSKRTVSSISFDGDSSEESYEDDLTIKYEDEE